MSAFVDNLQTLPPVNHLAALELYREGDDAPVAVLENKPGQAGSLRVYYALGQHFGAINAEAAEEGLRLYAEHTADAEANPGKHPNIDRLFQLRAGAGTLSLREVEKEPGDCA